LFPSEILNAIKTLENNQDLYQKFSQNCWNFFVKELSFEAFKKRIANFS